MNSSSKASTSLVCGIVSLVVGIIGGITFGIIGAAIALVTGIIGVVMGVGAKKETNGTKGTGGMVCGILGIVFGALFAISCTVCGAESEGYGCYGVVGGPMCLANDVENAVDDVYNDWY